MMTVAECATNDEALLLKSLLASFGVRAYLPDELTVTFRGVGPSVRLQVDNADAETARSILASKAPADAFARARDLIDAAHAADPHKAADGRPAELGYADRMETWISRIAPEAGPLLRLAARCQHLERWSVPRASYPMDRAGYLAWRRRLYATQSARASEILRSTGISTADAETLATWVAKEGLKTNPGTQALEDAAVLVFLESEIEAFTAQHAEYPREKFVEILRKTWRKMSPRARDLAQGLQLTPAVSALVRDATAA